MTTGNVQMDSFLKTTIWEQFGAAIDMLENALVACPDTLWNSRLWNDPSYPEYPEFWSITYHTLYWLDLYLTGTSEGFAPPAPFKNVLDETSDLPRGPYTKEELHGYLVYLRKKCQTTIDGLTDEKARQQVAEFAEYVGKPMSFLELLLLTMRHVQEHTAQLSLFLGQHAIPDEVLDWVGVAKDGEGHE